MATRKMAAETSRPGAAGVGRGPILPMTSPAPVVYVEGEIAGLIVRPLRVHRDGRGWLVELFREDEMDEALRPAMAYASTTLPGVARGPHEHRDQTDGFAFFGPSDFRLFAWDARRDSPTFGHRATWIVGESSPAAVWIPPGVVHAYRNIGDVPGLVFNAPNRLYAGRGKAEPVDEIRHEDADPHLFPMED